MYSIKEIFYSLQGEGARTGRPALFLRFAGCNLWNGREVDRPMAICNFCDTDFVGTDGSHGGKYKQIDELIDVLWSLWPDPKTHPYLVCTGGEPLLQLDQPLVDALHKARFEIAVETNGTILPPFGIDWICVSPKPMTELLINKGNELKFIFPQLNLEPEQFIHLDFSYFYLQPMDGPALKENIQSCLAYCLEHPKWSMSLQTHKLLNIR